MVSTGWNVNGCHEKQVQHSSQCRPLVEPYSLAPCRQPIAQGVEGLQEVVPVCLATACPGLIGLTIWHDMPEASAASPQQQQQRQQAPAVAALLQHLNITYFFQLPFDLLAPTLAALPCLTSLFLPDFDSDETVIAALEAVAGELTNLGVRGSSPQAPFPVALARFPKSARRACWTTRVCAC
jgi:hypothetical protein